MALVPINAAFDRYYDPSTAQFLSIDPDVAQTGQPYAYTADDPLNATDPMGLCAKHRRCPPPRKATGKQLKKIINTYMSDATTAECHCTGNPITMIASRILHAVEHHPLQALAFAATTAASAPLDETGAGEAIDDAEASAFIAADSASSARSGVMLGRQIASEAQTSEAGTAFAGAGTSTVLRDAPDLADQYGGAAEDWMKMSSSRYTGSDGLSFETHWYQNDSLGLQVEWKTNIAFTP